MSSMMKNHLVPLKSSSQSHFQLGISVHWTVEKKAHSLLIISTREGFAQRWMDDENIRVTNLTVMESTYTRLQIILVLEFILLTFTFNSYISSFVANENALLI